MRHSIFVKFIAVFLCAACLLAACGSAAGLLVMSELGLGSRTLEEAYRESVEDTARILAQELAVRHAGMELGGADRAMLEQYYGSQWLENTFDWDRVGYTITDAEGELVAERAAPAGGDSLPVYRTRITEGRYLNVLKLQTLQEYEQTRYPAEETVEPSVGAEPAMTVYNAVPVGGIQIDYITVNYLEGYSSEYGDGTQSLGLLKPTDTGRMKLSFLNASGNPEAHRLLDDFRGGIPVNMLFRDTRGCVVFEMTDSGQILEEFCDDPAYFVLRSMEDAQMLSSGSVYDAIAPEGQYVTECYVEYADSFAESAGGTPAIGWLGYDEEGRVCFTADRGVLTYRTDTVTVIRFWDEQQNMVYEAADPAGVGQFRLEGDTLVFCSPNSTGIPASQEQTGIYVYDDVPPQGHPVAYMELWLEGASRGTVIRPAEGDLGIARHDDGGNVVFQALNWQDFVFSKPAEVVYILMQDAQGRLLYEAKEEALPTGSGCSIGSFAYNGEGDLVFTGAARTAAGDTRSLPGETAPERMQTQLAWDADVLAFPRTDAQITGFLEANTQVELVSVQEIDGLLWGETPEGWILISEEPDAGIIPETEPAPTEVPEDTRAVPEETAEPSVTAPTLAPETEVMDRSAEPASTDPYEIALAEDTLRAFVYYDSGRDRDMMVEYTYEPMPVYTVEIRMDPGAPDNRSEWILVEQIAGVRQYLVPVLIGGLLLFAVCAVYLCSSAGRRPGTDEVRASGLNCIPLDLYLGAAAGGVVLCAWGTVEGGRYLLQQDPGTGILFGALCAFAACLLTVSFFFAFAAQVKTPGLYWWHNSICGRALRLCAWLWRRFLRLCAWLLEVCEEKLEPMAVRLFRGLWKLVKFFWLKLKEGTGRLCRLILSGCNWLSRILGRFFAMLPLIWQFLLVGFTLVFLLYIMMRTYKVGYILLGFGIFFGVILYAASAFGILLDNAKRMRKGDLDTKVDDRLLIGAFREFAAELNGLADVAVVAAQKQLKSERMKTELITNVSHDIKTPLTSIINYVDLMEKPHSPQEQQAYLEVLSRQSQRLKKLIDDLMEMSKASTGNMAVEITQVNAAEAVNQALGEFADKLENAQLTPVFRQPEKELSMMADGRLVWRVLSNVLSNAVKYAMPGTRLYIDLMELEGKVVLSLKNISRDSLNIHADELLERFVRGDTARNTEGSGLGLNIAKSLMELQKGRLELLVDGDLFKVTLIFPGA